MIDEYQLDEDNLYRVYSDKKPSPLNTNCVKYTLIIGSILILVGLLIVAALLLGFFVVPIILYPPGIFCTNQDYCKPREYQNGAVASDSKICSQIGTNVLKQGGNAADSAVSVAFCLGVVSPVSSGIGGGGSAVLYFPKHSQPSKFYDFRETAPLKSFKDMYNSNSEAAQRGINASAVPGEVKGLYQIFQEYGSGNITWSSLIQPSINLTRNGVRITKHVASGLERNSKELLKYPGMKKLFYNEKENRWVKEGDIVFYPDLGKTLEKIAQDPNTFYTGEVANLIIKDFESEGGILTKSDLENYKVETSDPLRSFYLGYEILGGQSEISGGACIAQALNILEGYRLGGKIKDGFTQEEAQLIAEAMKFMFGYRLLLGDSKFVNLTSIVPEMISKELAVKLRKKIVKGKTFTNGTYYHPPGLGYVDNDAGTTHFSVVDKDRNAVSLTSTINLEYGSFFVSPSTGIIMNDCMDDFSIPGRPNAFSMPPSENNFIVPGKRPLSSQSPTIVLNDGNVDLVVGGSGGPRIISATLHVLLYSLSFKMNIGRAVNTVRFHHQLYPMTLRLEDGYPYNKYMNLTVGHEIEELNQKNGFLGVTQAVKVREDGKLEASSDFRKQGDTDGY